MLLEHVRLIVSYRDPNLKLGETPSVNSNQKSDRLFCLKEPCEQNHRERKRHPWRAQESMISKRTQTWGKRGTDKVESPPSGDPVNQEASLKLFSLS